MRARGPLLLPLLFHIEVTEALLHREGASLARASPTWERCADEGQALPRAGPVRFGWGEAWREASLPLGSRCASEAFGDDPAPGVEKVCQCLQPASAEAEASRDDLGVSWSFCAAEGGSCDCQSGFVRFGVGSRWVRAASQRSRPLCDSAALGAGDPAPFQRKECWCQQPRAGSALRRDSVAVVALTRRAADLRSWLQYHLAYLAIDHVFLRVEDTPGFEALWQALPVALRSRVTLWREDDPGDGSSANASRDPRPADDYESLQARQLRYMARAKALAGRQGIDWLVHIDDDELLYVPLERHIGEVLGALPTGTVQAFIPNVEAVYPSSQVKSCFRETALLNVNRYAFQAYANGKAAIRVAAEGLQPAGPHSWRGEAGEEPESMQLDAGAFGSPILLVHFESCPFSRWESKFWELGNTSPEKVTTIPFPFYRESIRKMQACAGTAAAAAEQNEACDDRSLREFWSSWKTASNPKLKRQDFLPLEIPWAEVDAASVSQAVA